MSEASPSFKVSPGQPFPLGVSELENGVNFAIFSQHASSVILCLSLPGRWLFPPSSTNVSILTLCYLKFTFVFFQYMYLDKEK